MDLIMGVFLTSAKSSNMSMFERKQSQQLATTKPIYQLPPPPFADLWPITTLDILQVLCRYIAEG
jgi:hypothetical protein